MAIQNKTKIIVGLFLIIIAFVCGGAIIYFGGQANKANLKRVASLETQLINLISEKAQEELSSGDAKRVQRNAVKVEDLVAKAEVLYSEEERNRRDGVLWIDRKNGTCIITLGAINGLKPGSRLSVYQDSQQIDKITVDTPFDIISYVKPLQKPLNQFDSNYYRVVIENSP